jgi:hypothetical protein
MTSQPHTTFNAHPGTSSLDNSARRSQEPPFDETRPHAQPTPSQLHTAPASSPNGATPRPQMLLPQSLYLHHYSHLPQSLHHHHYHLLPPQIRVVARRFSAVARPSVTSSNIVTSPAHWARSLDIVSTKFADILLNDKTLSWHQSALLPMLHSSKVTSALDSVFDSSRGPACCCYHAEWFGRRSIRARYHHRRPFAQCSCVLFETTVFTLPSYLAQLPHKQVAFVPSSVPLSAVPPRRPMSVQSST